jgi:thymidylate synthase ThyX
VIITPPSFPTARVILDSVTRHGERLTTVEATYPLCIHAQLLRHRMLSRCVSSARAIPVSEMVEMVRKSPFVPEHWGANKPGMVAGDEIADPAEARAVWLDGAEHAIRTAERLAALGVHKQHANRVLAPYLWATEILTATDWANLYHLRCHGDAQPEAQAAVAAVRDAMAESIPIGLEPGEWHAPFDAKDRPLVSAGRVARGSVRRASEDSDAEKDGARAERMLRDGHMSPFEHTARAMTLDERDVYRMHRVTLIDGTMADSRDLSEFAPGEIASVHTTHHCANFDGWIQLRRGLRREWDRLGEERD